MTTFKLTILGTNSSMPGYGRLTSHQILQVDQGLYMIDCGEGAQIRLSQYKIKKNKIRAIFISHLHGDHFFGLPGLLTSYNHLERSQILRIFGPVGLKRFVNEVFKACSFECNFELDIIELDHEGMIPIMSNKELDVFAFPMKHRVSTFGYKFVEKHTIVNVDKEAIEKYGLTITQIKLLKSGKDILLKGGITLKNKEATLAIRKSRAYAYCSDTVFDPSLVPFIKKVDLLYHETTFLHELQNLAEKYMHSTTVEAAMIAKKAEVGQLVTGHYSGRYRVVEDFEKEAKAVFENTILGYDGLSIDIPQKN